MVQPVIIRCHRWISVFSKNSDLEDRNHHQFVLVKSTTKIIKQSNNRSISNRSPRQGINQSNNQLNQVDNRSDSQSNDRSFNESNSKSVIQSSGDEYDDQLPDHQSIEEPIESIKQSKPSSLRRVNFVMTNPHTTALEIDANTSFKED